MRIQNLYYKLGGEKGGFLQTKWSGYIQSIYNRLLLNIL